MARTTTRIRNENHGTSDTDEEERYAQNYAARSNEMNVNGKRKSSDGADDEGPACQSCRKKKAKCSRRQPCSQCVKLQLDCIYDDRRVKPGLRTGAVENLNQRVATLENMFLGQGVLWQQVWSCLNSLQSSIQPGSTGNNPLQLQGNLQECTSRLKSTLSSLSNSELLPPDQMRVHGLSKRQRLEKSITDQIGNETVLNNSSSEGIRGELLPDDLLNQLVDIYFSTIHPWIPILHVKQFRARMMDASQRPKLKNIFHAIISLCVRFSHDSRLSDSTVRSQLSERSRQIVILQSMESFSVENLQALIIVAFDTIGSGRGPSSWSIVGSMTRTVEQLQLSVEDEADPAVFMIQRMSFLPKPTSWSETEERRRIFWNVFLMDRFCSVATGWNCSLTSADVKRRLPCEGALWEALKEVKTPYFGVADKPNGPTAKHHPSPLQQPDDADQDSIGGFAYCIEATESLSLVTTFFLQHAVDVSNANEVQVWLMRFKELDLRLIQWKLFLPSKWREASVLNADGIMDPNLTLAHITHNTAVGLLHQGVAYPSPQWRSGSIRLPSASSAQTCKAAASEIAIIAEKFLQYSQSLTNPQFAFCLFISGRMLLAHSVHYDTSLAPEFDSLANSLQEIARRWRGPRIQPGTGVENLASKFAKRLVQARGQGASARKQDPLLDIRKTAYSEGQIEPLISKQQIYKQNQQPSLMGLEPRDDGAAKALDDFDHSVLENFTQDSPDSISLAFPPLPISFYHGAIENNSGQSVESYIQHGQQQQQISNAMYFSPNLDPGGFNFNLATASIDRNNGLGSSTDSVSEGNLNDLNSFLNQSFYPEQRVSIFSGGGVESEQHQ